MTLGRFSLITTVLLSICGVAGAATVTLDTNSYNFALNNGGGGAAATINKADNVEIFCVDFANDIYVPVQGYSAYLTTLTSGSDLSDTRFGEVASSNWTQMNTSFIDTTDANTINNATDLGRYQMAAFLVSNYNLAAGSNATNNGIQQAIWDILDPKSFTAVYNSATDAEIEAAAQWYTSMGGNTGSTALNSFLTNYRIVSSATMTSCGAGLALCGGFQEQITVVPEPRHLALMLMGLLLIGVAVFRKVRAAQGSNA